LEILQVVRVLDRHIDDRNREGQDRVEQADPRLVRSFVSLGFASLAPWRETLFWRSW
jgi:hypothetical protein